MMASFSKRMHFLSAPFFLPSSPKSGLTFYKATYYTVPVRRAREQNIDNFGIEVNKALIE